MTPENVPAGHAALVAGLRACIERGNGTVTMLALPTEATTVGRDGYGPLSIWNGDALCVEVRGPVSAAREYLAGDLIVRFTKTVHADIQVWDQGDASVFWHPGADDLSASPWFPVSPPPA